jgi:hypothetical protein
MADFSISTLIAANVDTNGDAIVYRDWLIQNFTNDTLDFSKCYFSLELTSLKVKLAALTADPPCETKYASKPVSIDRTLIECDYSAQIPPNGTFRLRLELDYPQYMKGLRDANSWFMQQYFGRTPLVNIGYIQEEPQHGRFTLLVEDPRQKILGILNPLKRWRLLSNSSRETVYQKGTGKLVYDFSLVEKDRSEDFFAVSTVGDRALILTLVTMVASPVVAFAVRSGLERIF